MSDPNVFAVLTPRDTENMASAAFRLPENAHSHFKTAVDSGQGIAEEPTIDSRESTPAPGPSSEQANYNSADRIMLRLNKLPKDPTKGWQFGTDPRICDYLLGHRGTSGISSRQFCITITPMFWVELHDMSRYGTCVGHDGQGKKSTVKNDKRLLSFEPGATKQFKEVRIYAPDEDGLAFDIEFPNHRSGGGGEYWQNLQTFVDDSRRALPPVDVLGLDSNPTTAPFSRQPRTPCKQSVYLDDEEIGHGEFGSVIRVIDARDGQVYAAKKFKPPFWTRNDSKKRKLEEEDWLDGIRNEYTIMKNNPHRNIVPAIYFQEKPDPFIVMEYCCLGNLEAFQDIKPEEYVSASRQMLIGLRHLHNNRVAHRDLKPANLLVANRHPFHVKISDFGLSKVVARNGFLKTFCGTLLYAAPEVGRTGYLPLIDIWSAGVIMMQLIFGLPYYDSNDQRPRTEWIKDWANMLLSRIGDLDENNDQVIDLIKNMVTMRPENRFTADECLERGCVNGLFKRRSDGQIVDIDASSEDDATELATEAGTEIASPPADPSDDSRSDDGGSDDGCATPTRQSPQRTEDRASNSSEAPTILIESLWSSDETGQQDSADPPSGQLTPTRRSNLGPPTRRRRTSRSHTSSWSLTIGLGHSDSDGGFDLDGGHSDGVATGLFIRKDRFSLSLESQFASEDETQEESSVRQGSLALPEPEQGVAVPMVLTSFEQRVLQLQA